MRVSAPRALRAEKRTRARRAAAAIEGGRVALDKGERERRSGTAPLSLFSLPAGIALPARARPRRPRLGVGNGRARLGGVRGGKGRGQRAREPRALERAKRLLFARIAWRNGNPRRQKLTRSAGDGAGREGHEGQELHGLCVCFVYVCVGVAGLL